jgi:hypothetical protein
MPYRFFLGGADLEMAELRKLLDEHAPGAVEDARQQWGAALSAYREALLTALARGETPVAIELADDLPAELFDRRRMIFVDHHGERAGVDSPSSIEQVFGLLALPPEHWTRWLALVAANDKAHLEGLRALGASGEEMASIRAADRHAQGLDAADEAEAWRAIATARRDGRLTIVHTRRSRSSAIVDFLQPELGGPGYDRLFVAMPGEVAVFADGQAIHELARHYPSSWWGGGLPKSGFWGMRVNSDEQGTEQQLTGILR